MASDAMTAPPSDASKAGGGRSRLARRLLLLAGAVILLDILAYIIVPPFPKGGAPGEACAFPACFIDGNLEFPPPNVVWDLDPANPLPSGPLVIGFHASITSTILTMWIVEALVLLVALLAARRLREIPGRLQNAFEWAYESLQNWAISNGGTEAVQHVPVFAAFFLLILFSNWSGLVPPVGKVDALRAPTSDVNITVGLALTAFCYMEWQGFRKNGVRGYLGKFFPLGELRKGLGSGFMAMFVGLIELMLEFVKPVTLSMRLFGNIYGGEVALGVITALTMAIFPLFIVGLEAMLNFVQALIFSTLTLIFTIIAMGSHGDEEHHRADAPAGEPARPVTGTGRQVAPAH